MNYEWERNHFYCDFYAKRKVEHPCFKQCAPRGWKGLPTVLFESAARFTVRNRVEMIRATRKAFPRHKVVDTWGGEGEYVFSVSLKPPTVLWSLRGKWRKLFKKELDEVRERDRYLRNWKPTGVK